MTNVRLAALSSRKIKGLEVHRVVKEIEEHMDALTLLKADHQAVERSSSSSKTSVPAL
jgi:hypothetical protein